MKRDNHFGPDFNAVKTDNPAAIRWHWAEDAFNPSRSEWLVGIPAAAAGGVGVAWVAAMIGGVA